MPILGADMEAGTLVEWHCRPGDHVERGDVIAEVETEKGLIEIEVFTSGIVEKIVVAPGEKVPVGTVMALIREDTGVAQAAAEAVPPAPGAKPPRAPSAPAALQRSSLPIEAPHVRASPAARRRAAALGVELASLSGTGPDGAITVGDVERAAPHGSEAMRRAIGAAMARSKREIPHYYLASTIDMARAVSWLQARNAARPVTERLLPTAVLLKAAALALREVPELNGTWSEHGAVLAPDVHLGVAIALRGGGLIAPALHHADRLQLDELMRRLRDLVTRARAGSLRSSELSDPTITVTSLGDQGADSVFGVIYPPQVAIVGFGKVADRPWVFAGQVVPRPVVTATLAADHRVSDGHRGARFLAALDRLLGAPEAL